MEALEIIGLFAPALSRWMRAGQHRVNTRCNQYFPQVPLAELVRFLQMRTAVDETTLLRLFRDWVQQLAAGWTSPQQP